MPARSCHLIQRLSYCRIGPDGSDIQLVTEMFSERFGIYAAIADNTCNPDFVNAVSHQGPHRATLRLRRLEFWPGHCTSVQNICLPMLRLMVAWSKRAYQTLSIY